MEAGTTTLSARDLGVALGAAVENSRWARARARQSCACAAATRARVRETHAQALRVATTAVDARRDGSLIMASRLDRLSIGVGSPLVEQAKTRLADSIRP